MPIDEVENWEIVAKDNPAPLPAGPPGAKQKRIALSFTEIMASIARWREELDAVPTSILKSVNYTASDNEWIEASNAITISLPPSPSANDQVIVSNGDGSIITISGNGSNIKHTSVETQVQTINQGTTLHFQYFNSGSYWRII